MSTLIGFVKENYSSEHKDELLLCTEKKCQFTDNCRGPEPWAREKHAPDWRAIFHLDPTPRYFSVWCWTYKEVNHDTGST